MEGLKEKGFEPRQQGAKTLRRGRAIESVIDEFVQLFEIHEFEETEEKADFVSIDEEKVKDKLK